MALLPEYQGISDSTNSNLNAQRQQNNDALQRRFAAMGGLNSGSYIKQQQISDDNQARQAADANANIGLQSAQEGQRRKELGEARQFQTSERLGSQDFAHGEAGLARNQQGEQFNQTFGLQSKTQADQKAQADRQLQLQAEAQGIQAGENQFNMDQAKSAKKAGMVNGMFDPGGITGGAAGNILPGGGGSFFCTEMHEKGVIAAHSFNRVTRLVESVLFSRPEQLEFYYEVAPAIIAAARLYGFDWSKRQETFVHSINALLDSGESETARELYLNGVRDMCLEFAETKHLWNEEIRNTSVAKSVGAFLRLMGRPKIRKLIFQKTFGGFKWRSIFHNKSMA